MVWWSGGRDGRKAPRHSAGLVLPDLRPFRCFAEFVQQRHCFSRCFWRSSLHTSAQKSGGILLLPGGVSFPDGAVSQSADCFCHVGLPAHRRAPCQRAPGRSLLGRLGAKAGAPVGAYPSQNWPALCCTCSGMSAGMRAIRPASAASSTPGFLQAISLARPDQRPFWQHGQDCWRRYRGRIRK